MLVCEVFHLKQLTSNTPYCMLTKGKNDKGFVCGNTYKRLLYQLSTTMLVETNHFLISAQRHPFIRGGGEQRVILNNGFLEEMIRINFF